jgi:hypothetical protein
MTGHSFSDAVVSANNLEGRRRLLLEPIPQDNADDDEGGLGEITLLQI